MCFAYPPPLFLLLSALLDFPLFSHFASFAFLCFAGNDATNFSKNPTKKNNNTQSQTVKQNAFHKSDLEAVFKYLDDTNDGSVSIEETLSAFSKAKRAKVEMKMQRKGKILLKKLYEIVVSHGLTIEDWFNSMDTTFQKEILLEETDSEDEDDDEGNGASPQSQERSMPNVSSLSPTNSVTANNNRNCNNASPNWFVKKTKKGPPQGTRPKGVLSTYELRAGFKRMAESSKDSMKFTQTDLINLLRYVDPNGDGDLSFDELEDALRRINHKSEEEKYRDYIFDILRRIEDVAKSNGSMIMTVFFNLDTDGSGEVSMDEFIDGVMALKRSDYSGKRGYHEPTFASNDELQSAIDAQEINKKEMQHNELLRLEKCGAGRVLRVISGWTKERGLTITMLIKVLDKNGDGEVSHAELVEGIKKFFEPSTRVRAAKKRRAMKEAQQQKDDRARMMAAHRLQTQIQHAEACGAINALSSLESFMRKNCLRVKDMFEKIDADGDGGVDARELRKALKKCKLYMTKVDVKALVKFLDTSRDGTVQCEELEGAIKTFRRYAWQKSEIDVLLKNVKDIPLFERCDNIEEVFGMKGEKVKSSGGQINGQELADGLMRMRGDKDARLWILKEKDFPESGENGDAEGGGRNGSKMLRGRGRKGGSNKSIKKKQRGMGKTSTIPMMTNDGEEALPDIFGAGGSTVRGNPSGMKRTGMRGGGRGGDGLFGGSASLPSLGNDWTPAYVERLYNLNQQASFKSLFAS